MDKRYARCEFAPVLLSLGLLAALLFAGCSASNEKESDAVLFDRIARDAFKEVYPSLADQILADYEIRNGVCLDIGCGSAYLGIEIAKRSRLKVIGVDIDPEALRIARRNIKREKLEDRVAVEEGDVHDLRFSTDSIDLVISRGSFLFWENIAQSFREIHRVLKPGGVAFVGGGMGRAISPAEKQAIKLKIEQAGLMDRCRRTITPVIMQEILESANIQNFKITGDGAGDSGCRCGLWVEIRK